MATSNVVAGASTGGGQGVITLEWHPPLATLSQALVRRTQRLMVVLWRLADNFATRIETWMQAFAPWNDRSGEARTRLRAEAFRMGLALGITVAHGVPYGIFLETMQAGRFAILVPAVMEWLPKFFVAAQEAVKNVR